MILSQTSPEFFAVLFSVVIGALVLGLIWCIVQMFKPPTSRSPIAGPAFCPFCGHQIAPYVRQLGQQIICPNCHGICLARPANILLKILLCVFWLIVLAIGGVAIWNF